MSTRAIYFLGFLCIFLLLAFSVYLQIFANATPCPLCTLQRLTFGILGCTFLVGAILSPYRFIRIIIDILLLIFSAAGVLFAGRQVWLQRFPTGNEDACGVGLDYMMQVLPMNEVIRKVLIGSAECTERGWEFLHLNMAEWAIIWFGIFFISSIYLLIREKKLKLKRLF